MEVNYCINEDTLIVNLSGEIDHHTAEQLRHDIDAELKFFQTKNLIFDFSGVEFMDSSGIGVVLGRYKKVNAMGGSVKICNASRLVRQILDMSGVFTLIAYDDAAVE